MLGHDGTRSSSGVKLTYEDFLLFPDDGKRHELIDGVHFVSPSPTFKHQGVCGNLYFQIRLFLESHPIGQVFFAPLDVVISNFDIVEPDLFYLSNERAARVITPENMRGVPEIVVEIASKGTRKRDGTIKLRLYERVGVNEYWIVDPKREVVRIYRRVGERFGAATELSHTAGETLTTTLIPDLRLPLAGIFRT